MMILIFMISLIFYLEGQENNFYFHKQRYELSQIIHLEFSHLWVAHNIFSLFGAVRPLLLSVQ
jgi:hypothetical protein